MSDQANASIDDSKPQVSVIQSAAKSLQNSTRRILVMGPRGSGKTTFSVSASKFAGESISGPRRECKDVLVIQGDNEGIMGAMDTGLVPGAVLDMCKVRKWDDYWALLMMGLKEMQGHLQNGSIKVVVVDLAWPAKLIEKAIKPQDPSDWGLVAAQGQRLFGAFGTLRNVTVIGNTQMKPSTVFGEGTRKGATDAAVNAADVRAIGGERASFTVDLPKGISSMWLDNASFIFTRESKRKKVENNTICEFSTISQSNSRYEAKSRAQSVIAAKEDGNISLHALLKRAYGDSL